MTADAFQSTICWRHLHWSPVALNYSELSTEGKSHEIPLKHIKTTFSYGFHMVIPTLGPFLHFTQIQIRRALPAETVGGHWADGYVWPVVGTRLRWLRYLKGSYCTDWRLTSGTRSALDAGIAGDAAFRSLATYLPWFLKPQIWQGNGSGLYVTFFSRL